MNNVILIVAVVVVAAIVAWYFLFRKKDSNLPQAVPQQTEETGPEIPKDLETPESPEVPPTSGI
ncbi:hypothetical protein ACFL11_01445 [Patescibacteria group bacterium]